ncbi:MAG: acetyl-coenzyme A synthetase, partial [Nitrospina sp.]|nr:acetyl-coenzyme A synthetase [Nitrospina sp.]
MSEIYIPQKIFSSNALVRTMDEYKNKYQRSLDDPDAFWTDEAEQLVWFDKWKTVRQFNYDVRNGSVSIEWFKGGKTNITVNCIDRHLETRGEQTAILWEGNEPGENSTLSYNQLYA